MTPHSRPGSTRGSRRTTAALTAALLTAAAAACGGDDDDTVVLTMLAYDSFVAPESLLAFEEETGIEVRIALGGDGATLVNKAILTAGNPEGDVLWGIDETMLARASDAEVFAPHAPADLASLDPDALALVPEGTVTPVDRGDVCVNIDIDWFADRGIIPPNGLAALADPALADLLVVQNPATSSPGFAFLLATIAEFGEDGFAAYWADLVGNGVLVVDGWETAYFDEFTAGGGGGDRPIVVSYASSPPASIVLAEEPRPTEPTTAAVEATCYRLLEFAGVLRGTEHETEARMLVDHLIGAEFQSELPLTNFVYPVRNDVALPDVFEKFAKRAADPLAIEPATIEANRNAWIETWTRTVLG